MRNRFTYISTLKNALTKSIALCFICFFSFKVALAPYCLDEDTKIVYEMNEHTDGEEGKKGSSESQEEESKKGSEEFIEHKKTSFSGSVEEIDHTFCANSVFFKDAESKLITPPPQV